MEGRVSRQLFTGSILLSFLLIFVMAYGQIDANINGSFEASPVTTGGDTSSIEGWIFNKDSADLALFTIVDDPVKDGNRALAVAIDDTGEAASAIEALCDSLILVPGETYRYSVWIRSTGSGSTVHLIVRTTLFGEFLRLELNDTLNTDWQLYTTEITSPGGADTVTSASIYLSFAENIGDTIYIDSLRITQLTGLPPEPDRYPVIVEAESGTLGSEFDNLEVGGVQFITISTDYEETTGSGSYPGANRTASYQVTFPDTGTYDFFARVRVGPAGFDDDSFFYGNGFGVKNPATSGDWIVSNGLGSAGFSEPDDVVYDAGAVGSNVWKWVNLSRNPYQGNSRQFTIDTPDSLTRIFEIGGRENGLSIDKMAFGKSRYFFTVENLDSAEAGSITNPWDYVEPPPREPLAKGKAKFLGNGYSHEQLYRFEEYWNQVVPGNAGKWGSVEGSRDVMNWAQLDIAYDLAKDNGFIYRHHVLVWGSQQPEWIETLSPAEQLEEIEEWFAAVAARYPDINYLEVVNEPLHDPPNKDDNGGGNYINALGGSNDLYGTGWDWVIKAFELAREYFPDTTKLVLNDYSITSNNSTTTTYLNLIALLQERNLIDCIGIQGHAFETRGSMSTVTYNLNRLAATGLPIMVTEMDIDGGTSDPTEEDQLAEYQRIFPTFWEHPGVIGITLWGWRPGMWIPDAILINTNGSERLAMQWLSAYVDTAQAGLTDISVDTKGLPEEFYISNNYPNPFNPATQMNYNIAKRVHVKLEVYDIIGRLVDTIVNGIQSPGKYTVTFNAGKLASGIYFYRFKAGSYNKIKRMILIK
jgi:endo-1,4-beta-xylanase